ncbi:MAG: hypothetical protein M3069_09400 [Chloroflexota bacterium]|nr:hypothetical protein [Chloroflexota bacterium]
MQICTARQAVTRLEIGSFLNFSSTRSRAAPRTLAQFNARAQGGSDAASERVLTSVRGWTRWLLLGSDDSWGATLATGRLGISLLAMCALLMHVLDLATGLRMMQLYGIELEQNPLARSIMQNAGAIGLIEMKLGVVLAGVLLLVRTAHVGRPRLARNCLLLALGIGILGWSSNLVG